MKYRELTPSEIEAYDIGYKVGNRKIVITDIEWESENEHKIYRKGYMAGLMDYKRNVNNVSIVSKVNNVEIETSTTSTTPIGISISKGNMFKDKDNDKVNENTLFNAGFQNWVFPVEIKKVAAKHWSAETIREIEKRFSCQEYNTETCIFDLLSQYPEDKTKRFVKPTVEEIESYCKERNNNIDPQYFFDYYERNGWKVNKNPMKDWKACIRTWEKNNFNRPQQPQKKNWSNYVGEGSFLKPDGEW